MDNQVLGYKDLAAIPKDKAILDIERPDLMIYEPHFTYSLLEHVELPRSREVSRGNAPGRPWRRKWAMHRNKPVFWAKWASDSRLGCEPAGTVLAEQWKHKERSCRERVEVVERTNHTAGAPEILAEGVEL